MDNKTNNTHMEPKNVTRNVIPILAAIAITTLIAMPVCAANEYSYMTMNGYERTISLPEIYEGYSLVVVHLETSEQPRLGELVVREPLQSLYYISPEFSGDGNQYLVFIGNVLSHKKQIFMNFHNAVEMLRVT